MSTEKVEVALLQKDIEYIKKAIDEIRNDFKTGMELARNAFVAVTNLEHSYNQTKDQVTMHEARLDALEKNRIAEESVRKFLWRILALSNVLGMVVGGIATAVVFYFTNK